MTEERLEQVTSKLQASPELRRAIEAAIQTDSVPAPIANALTAAAVASVKTGSDRLESVVPVGALEAIVRRFGRPPLLVRDDTVVLEPLPDFDPGTDVLIKKVEPAVKSVGRVEFLNFRMPWGGTGWVIDGTGNSRVVATNRHVAKLVARRAADGTGVFMRSLTTGVRYGLRLDFKEEVDSTPSDAIHVDVSEVLYLADDTAADVAFLRITGNGLPSPLPLASKEAVQGDLVALVGYPAFDDRNNVNDQARYFKDLFEVKRFAPGFVMEALSSSTILRHDCTSLGGNSGSPLIRLTDGAVVGLHFAGLYGVENSAVGVDTLRALLKGERPVSVAVLETVPEAARDGVHQKTDFDDRDGYDPAFLDAAKAPWPGLPAGVKSDLARPSDATAKRPHEIRYTHFGVLFSKRRRQPVMTAVNIDGAHTVRIKRSNDKWFCDLRIPKTIQLGQDDYDDREIDRGHMVRREDPNWDPAIVPGPDVTSTLAKRANFDTFHYTNAAVQHSSLNQGKQLWLGLESHILDNARTMGFKACVFTGPVNRTDDPEIKPGVFAPREFWKVVVMLDADGNASKLHATAYLLSQGDLIRELLERRSRTEGMEGFVLGEYRTFQIAIRDLADATGYDFSPYLAADPLAATKPGQEAIKSDEPLFVPLDSLDQVVL